MKLEERKALPGRRPACGCGSPSLMRRNHGSLDRRSDHSVKVTLCVFGPAARACKKTRIEPCVFQQAPTWRGALPRRTPLIRPDYLHGVVEADPLAPWARSAGGRPTSGSRAPASVVSRGGQL